ncbi:hypothetical protein [Nocardia alba]|uniref:Uncharacterized protein n=1 Tax=Nocardia alba TaxID=225051 RepID=A0A4V2PCA2_9NOCA|nr:hypothetical protein [Nocardia alba]TCK00566.1 hypothetical protein DFR71_1572 [Nocardia alba]
MTESTTFAASSALGAEDVAASQPSEPSTGVLHAAVEIVPALDDGVA